MAAATEVGAGLEVYAAAAEDYKRLKTKYGKGWFGAGRQVASVDTRATGPLAPYRPKDEPKWEHVVGEGRTEAPT